MLITDYFGKASIDNNYAIATTVKTTRTVGVTVLEAFDLSKFSDDTPVFFITYKKTTDPLTDEVTVSDLVSYKALVNTGANTLTNLTVAPGYTDIGNDVGDFVECIPTSYWVNSLVDGIGVHTNPDGTLKTTAVQTALGLGTDALNGWNPLVIAQSGTIVNNGNRSYTVPFASDVSATLSPGMRLRSTRTVAAPTQCTSLNGTTQYYSKTSPAGMTFTNNFVVGAWVKLTSYTANATIISRYNGTSGWSLQLSASGQLSLFGFNAATGNYALSQAYQSLPLNKWVHVAAQLDMTTTSVGTTNNYIMIDGVEVPNAFFRAGTSPTALIQAGNLEIGSSNGGANLFPGKIAQAFVTSAKITQAVIRSNYYAQSISPTETNVISAYSFNNSITDLNTTNANNLTANGSAVATNADSPFGGQAGGTISSTLDYGIIQTVSASTIVVQMAEGCTIPTSGGVSAVSYSSVKAPFLFPSQRSKWIVNQFLQTSSAVSISGYSTNLDLPSIRLTMPIGAWKLALKGALSQDNSSGGSIFTQVWLSLSQAGSQIYQTKVQVDYQAATLHQFTSVYTQADIETAAAATIYGVVYTTTGGGTVTGGLRGDQCPVTIELENSYL